MVECKCKNCNKIFQKRQKQIFCSRECSNSFNTHPNIEKICPECKNIFVVKYYKRNASTFCSRKCSTKHRLLIQDFKKTGRNISDNIKERQNNGSYIHPLQGKHHTEETKQKISKTRIENGLSAGENNSMFGKNHTIESRQNMSKTKCKKIINGEYGGWFCKGKIFSNKMNKEIYYKSSWEKKVIEILENDIDIISFIYEPFIIPFYYTLQRVNKNYIPDFLVEYRNGDKKLIEIKPSSFLKHEININKFQAAEKYCKENNMMFEVWSEKELDI